MSPGVTEARKRWPNAIWIIGSGYYASVSECSTISVMLFDTPMEAKIAKELIDHTGCCSRCRRDHEIIFIGKPKPKRRPRRPQWDREKRLALLVIRDGLTLDTIAAMRSRTRGHTARQICFGAYVMRGKDPRAAKLSALSYERGVGYIKAIKKYLATTGVEQNNEPATLKSNSN